MSSKNTDFKKETVDNTAYPVQEFFHFYIFKGKKNSFSQIFVPLRYTKTSGSFTLAEINESFWLDVKNYSGRFNFSIQI